MRITFYSNFLNHHQLPLSLALQRETKNQYTFVATEKIPQNRLELGYEDMNHKYPFVLTTYDSDENMLKAEKLALESDVVIIGSAPDKYIRKRVKSGGLTFRYNERLYKNGIRFYKYPRYMASALLKHKIYQKYPLYMLCASAYTAYDYAEFGNYIGKTYKWGYFPAVNKYDFDELFLNKHKNSRVSLLWAGRLIDWKHPDDAVALARYLKNKGYKFTLKIIGNGYMEDRLNNMIKDSNLSDCVELLGAMPPEKVRKNMEQADIFLFTSDFQEGWGAVLNESMNSGCAVVANHAIGSVPFLINDGKNGLIYENGNFDSFASCVEKIIDNADYREEMGRNAYNTVMNVWNADVAAERIVNLSRELLNGEKEFYYKEGPCSKAEKLKNGWYRYNE